jgi:phosphohistidine phosphatase SixA
MKNIIYMVRHGESPKIEGNERTRGLTDKGRSDALTQACRCLEGNLLRFVRISSINTRRLPSFIGGLLR